MQDIQKQLPGADDEVIQQENDHKEANRPPDLSQHAQDYHEKMSYFHRLITNQTMSELVKKFQREGIVYSQHRHFRKNLHLKIKAESINREVVVVRAQWGHFALDIHILNIRTQHPPHRSIISHGAHGNIFQHHLNSPPFSIKCVPLQSMLTRSRAIKEWFLLKVTSVAQISPKLSSILGFDLLMYNNCVQFAMELCQPCLSSPNRNLLYWNLCLMHRLHIVHTDIKPENIMLSPGYKKTVFIDFGLSKFVAEDIGFKTLTFFSGSIRLCSEEMSRCFLEKRQRAVDLYFNDLTCLQGSFRQLTTNRIDQLIEEDESSNYRECEAKQSLSEEKIDYVTISQLKFHLFHNQTSSFFSLWHKNISAYNENLCRVQILEFLMELSPNKQLKSFLEIFASEERTEVQRYSKLKMLYDLSYQRLWSLNLLKDSEKLACFESYCQEYTLEGSDRAQSQRIVMETVHELMQSTKLQANKVEYKQFVKSYLKYMSYTKNIYKITAQDRLRCAKKYYYEYAKQDILPELTGTLLIKQTIKHIASWSLSAEELKQDPSSFHLLIFYLFDFMMVLDIISQDYFFNWAQMLLGNQLFSKDGKWLLLQRGKSCIGLYEKRLFKGTSTCHLGQVQRLWKWIGQQQNKLREPNDLEDLPTLSTLDMAIFDDQFKDEFGLEIFGFSQLLRFPHANWPRFDLSLIDLVNSISLKGNHKKAIFFLIGLFNHNLYQRANFGFCSNILKIFHQNINDPSIINQFCMSFELQASKKAFQFHSFSAVDLWITQIENQLTKVAGKGLILLRHMIVTVFDSIDLYTRLALNQYKKNLSLFDKCTSFSRFSESFLDQFQKILFGGTDMHHLLTQSNLLTVLMLSNQIKSHGKKIDNIFIDKRIEQIKCQNCSDKVKSTIAVYELSIVAEVLVQRIDKNEPAEMIEQVAKDYYCLMDILGRAINQIDDMQAEAVNILEMALFQSKIICSKCPMLQDKYHGNMTYFYFVRKHNALIKYFTPAGTQNSKLQEILTILYHHHYHLLLPFMMELAKIVEDSQVYYYFTMLFFNCENMLVSLKPEQQLDLLQEIHRYILENQIKSGYVAIYFGIFLKKCGQKQTQGRLIAAIFKHIHKVNSQLRRQLGLLICFKKYENISLSQISKRRQAKFVTHMLFNMLVKEENMEMSKIQQKMADKRKKAKMKKVKTKNKFLNHTNSYYFQKKFIHFRLDTLIKPQAA